jgi:TRAP-type C4-dicarboxylate transport system substrate-binding protein
VRAGVAHLESGCHGDENLLEGITHGGFMATGRKSGCGEGSAQGTARGGGLRRLLAAALTALVLPGAAPAQETVTLRVVGGLAGLQQYTRLEQPFWSTRLAELSGGRYRADIVPFDRAGVRPPEMLGLSERGSIPFGTVQLSASAARDLVFAAPDLAGLNADIDAVRVTIDTVRVALATQLRERYGAELLAVYTYPAQVLWCKTAFARLEDLRGRRVRTSSTTQADWVGALGALPVSTPFADIVANMRNGNIDCAITGTMSGVTIGLHEHATHLHAMPVNWGVSMFVAHAPSWRALPADLRALLSRELPALEQAVWKEAEAETAQGISCATGRGGCPAGARGGRLKLVQPAAADEELRRTLLLQHVVPRWIERCGPECETLWNRTLAPRPRS